MLRICLLLQSMAKELIVSSCTDEVLFDKVLCPTTRPSELASLAADTASAVQRFSLPQTRSVLELFARQGVRHESLMLSCFWKIFKSDLPVLSKPDEVSLRKEFAVCTATTFRLLCNEGFIHDPELVAVGLGRCIECAPEMPFRGIVDIYEGVKLFDRSYFSVAEVALYSAETPDHQILKASHEISSRVLASQPNILDVLCGELEMRLHSMSDEDLRGCSSLEMVRLMRSLASTGVAHTSTLSVLRTLTEHMKSIPCDHILRVLESLHRIHLRVLDVLNHDGDDDMLRSERLEFVRALTSKLIVHNVFQSTPKPELILDFRKLFEKYPTLAEDAPRLWDAIRSVRVAHKHTVQRNEKKHRPDGSLFSQRYALKVKPIMTDMSEAEKYVPPQFKSWRSPSVQIRRHRASSIPKKMGFGTRRISKNYLKMKRKKFTPTVH